MPHGGPGRAGAIATDRLILRPTVEADAERAFEIQSDWAVARMLRMASYPPIHADLRRWFADHAREWEAGEAFRFAIEREGRMIGVVDVDEVAHGEGELGYWLERTSWGQGFAFEAAHAVTRFAFGEVALSRLLSAHAMDNPASAAVLTKLGFEPIAGVERFSRPRGKAVLYRQYSLDAGGSDRGS